MEEQKKQEAPQLPNEVYLNKVKMDDGKIALEASGIKQDDESITYIRADIFSDLFEEVKTLSAEETSDAVRLSCKTIDLVRSANNVMTVKTYIMAVLFIIVGLTLTGLSLAFGLLCIVLLNLVLSIYIDRVHQRKFQKAVNESEIIRQERHEQRQRKQDSQSTD